VQHRARTVIDGAVSRKSPTDRGAARLGGAPRSSRLDRETV